MAAPLTQQSEVKRERFLPSTFEDYVVPKLAMPVDTLPTTSKTRPMALQL